MRVKPFPKCPWKSTYKKQKGRSFDRPRNENNKYYLIRGYGPSRALRVSTHAGFVACGILPKWLPKWIACIISSYIISEEVAKNQELFWMLCGGGRRSRTAIRVLPGALVFGTRKRCRRFAPSDGVGAGTRTR